MKYDIEVWEKELVWVNRTYTVEVDEKLDPENAEQIETAINENCIDCQSDYNWDTSELMNRDLTDIKITEV